MSSVSLGKTIYFGVGPAIYLGAWIIGVSFEKSPDMAIFTTFLINTLCASAMYLVLCFVAFKLHMIFDVPAMKRNGVYNAHAKLSWLYALLLGVPAALQGIFAVMMRYTGPGGSVPQFNWFLATTDYMVGWLLGCASGAFFSYMFIAFAVPLLKMIFVFGEAREI